jgi:DNA adenine methylase
LYNILKQEGDKFIRYCKRYFNGSYNNAESYYQLRDRFNHCRNPRQKAALFVYLNRHGYNGLCRYNAKGGYNVPFGRYNRPYFPQKEMLAFHYKAQRAEFIVSSFETTMNNTHHGDVIYCDPPYVPLSNSANFTSYSAGGFNLDKQQQLALLAEQAASRGIPVLISNHNTHFTQQAYQMASQRDTFQVRRYISCNGENRQNAGEVLALFT